MKARLGHLFAFGILIAVFFSAIAGHAEPPNESKESTRARFERQREEVNQELRAQKLELIKLMATDDPDPDKCKKKLDHILSTERKRQYLFLDEMFAIRKGMSESEWRDYRRSVIMMMMNRNHRI